LWTAWTQTERCRYNNRKRNRQTDRYGGAHTDRDREVHLGGMRSNHGQTRRNRQRYIRTRDTPGLADRDRQT